jgi:hypothetical protein
MSCRSFTSSCYLTRNKASLLVWVHGVLSLLAALVLKIHLILVILICTYVTGRLVNRIAYEVSAKSVRNKELKCIGLGITVVADHKRSLDQTNLHV